MFQTNSNLSLSFESDIGRFRLEGAEDRKDILVLHLEIANQEDLLLGYYCSISDAVFAVAQQQTGYAQWDQIDPMELPSHVHDIASWSFREKDGTIPQAACS